MANANPPVPVVAGLVFVAQLTPPAIAHPHVVVAVSGDDLFVVNWTDRINYEESTCELNVGDHPAITKPSVMFYPRYRESKVRDVGLELANGTIIRRLDDLRPEVLARVIEGARCCPDLKRTTKAKYGL